MNYLPFFLSGACVKTDAASVLASFFVASPVFRTLLAMCATRLDVRSFLAMIHPFTINEVFLVA